MPMTKQEEARLERAETLAALRWTAPVEKDVPPPEGAGIYSEGWTFNAYAKRVEICWSSVIYHGFGRAPQKGEMHRSAAQGVKWLFSTEEKALAAMRHEVERQAAADLFAIDRKIEAVKEKASTDAKEQTK